MLPMDVTDDASIRSAVQVIMEREQQLDVVLNNAGYGIAGAIEDTTPAEIQAQFETNFFGVFRVCHATIPILRAQGSGLIITISSISGLIGVPFQGAYTASKFALEGLMEVLRMELKPYGVGVVLIEPGDFRTGFTDNRIRTATAQAGSVYQDRFIKALQVMEQDERNGPEPTSIARLLVSIIDDPKPRLRYTVGPFLEILAVHLKKILPSRLFELLIRKTYGL